MTTDTDAALAALIKQMQTLTETVEAQSKRMDDLHAFNGKILDEKKDLERQIASDRSKSKPDPATDARRKELEAMGFEKRDDGNWYPKGETVAHTITREDARDPRKYAAAKEAAAKAGKQVQIVDPQSQTTTDQHRRNNSRPDIDTNLKTTLVTDDHRKVAYLRRDVMGSDARQYQQLRRDGFTVEPFNTADDLPSHMQTKLSLMEKADT